MRKIVVSKIALKSSILIGDYIEAKFSMRRREEFVEN